MFRLDDDFTENDLAQAVYQVEKNYVIQPDDYLELRVYTNKGERIIDPEFELQQGINNQQTTQDRIQYLVMEDGKAKFPIIGLVNVDGLSINQAEKLLQQKYDEFYNDSFVRLSFNNKRVVVLGAVSGQVITLENENMSLLEVIAQAGGAPKGSKVNNITVIRGDLKNPEVFKIDLTTVAGMKQSILTIEPGDVIYIEPWRRVFFEGMADILPVMSFITSTLALILVLQNL